MLLNHKRLVIADCEAELKTCNLLKDLAIEELHEEIKQLKEHIRRQDESIRNNEE